MSTDTATFRRLKQAIAEVIRPNAASVDHDARFPHDSLRSLADAGMYGATIPHGDGGLELSALEVARAVTAIGEACASTALIYVMHFTALSALLAFTKGQQRDSYLGRIAAGELLVTEAISEPGSGSQWWSVHSTAERLPNASYRIRAKKSFCTTAGYADAYVVTTQAPGQSSDRAHALFLVPALIPGISAGAWNGLGLRGNMSSMIEFDCVVPADSLLVVDDGHGQTSALRQYNEINQPLYHLGIGATYTGISRATLNAVSRHIAARTYAGRPTTSNALKEYPIAQRHIGNIAIATLQAEALVEHFARQIDDGIKFAEFAPEMTAVKAGCADTAVAVTAEAMLAAGGTSFISGLLPIERHLRDSLAAPLMGPNNDFCKELIGRLVLGGDYHDL